ncbi:MAG: hypothetical protein JO142_02135 [Burkholderiales bacterium]|nr:hypothetical protein [Burkholderiales bacterium]
MNAKTLKAIRGALRRNGIDFRDRQLVETGRRTTRDVQIGLLPNGEPKLEKRPVTGTITLAKDCGRARYQAYKRQAAHA